MKFISKSTNLRIVLIPELAPQALSGFPGRSGMTVRFQGGLAVVDDEKWVEMMLKHPGFGVDFISADTTKGIDPYAYTRQDSEPQHVMTEMKYGSPEKRIIGGSKTLLTPEAMKVVQELATEMAKNMLPGMMEAYLQAAVKKHQDDKSPIKGDVVSENDVPLKPVVTRGRPRKTVVPEVSAPME